jgi:hypothetical protein
MIEKTDKIGIVRQHRWLSADKQAEALAPRCRTIISLGGGSHRVVAIKDVQKLARKGTVFELVHAFLLIDAKPRRRAVALKTEIRAALAKIEKAGAVVVDVDAGICSTKHRKAFLALVDSDIARSQKGSKSATNGALSKGRPVYNPTMQELKDAKAIWRDDIEYPEWDDCDAALRANVNKKFTALRAYDLWGPRTGKRR